MFDKSAKSRIISEKKVRCGPVRKVSHSDQESKNLIWKLCELYLEFRSASLIIPNCKLVWNIHLIKSLFSFPGKKAITISRFIDNVETAKSGVHIQDIRSNKECELIQHKWCLRLLACVDFFFIRSAEWRKKFVNWMKKEFRKIQMILEVEDRL